MLDGIVPMGVAGNGDRSKVNGCSTVVKTSFMNKSSSNVAFWWHNTINPL